VKHQGDAGTASPSARIAGDSTLKLIPEAERNPTRSEQRREAFVIQAHRPHPTRCPRHKKSE